MKPALAFIKKHLVALICGVLTILAVVSLYWPTAGLYTSLQAELEQHIGVGSSADALLKKQRTMPLLSPDQTTPDPLTVFPQEQVTQKAEEAIDKVTAEAKTMMAQAQSANQHQLLVDGELPNPSNDVRYQFALAYTAEINNYARWQKVLDSTTPPAADEITSAQTELHNKITNERVIRDPQTGNPDPNSVSEAEAEYASEAVNVKPNMESERAEKHRIYLMPSALPVDTTINIQNLPTPDRICDAQFAMWVFDDVCAALARLNDSDSDPAPNGPPEHDILNSVVKQLESISAPVPVLNTTGFDATAGVSSATPNVTTISPTGRVSNGLYDVLQFKVNLVCDAGKIPLVVRAMEAGQYITVLNVQITEVVDPVMAVGGSQQGQGGFRYGDKPVVRLELTCEELFMHSWTDAILPDSRKGGLGGTASAAGASNPGSPAGGVPGPPAFMGGMPGAPPPFGGRPNPPD